MKGLQTLLKVIDESKLTRLILFSSAAGFFGNAGQSDYAAANEVLNQYAIQFSQNLPECQVVSFNWGPWEGGMVTPQLKEHFAKLGVPMIPLDIGAQMLADELTKELSEDAHEYARVGRASGRWTLGPDARAPESRRGRALENPDSPQVADDEEDEEPPELLAFTTFGEGDETRVETKQVPNFAEHYSDPSFDWRVHVG